MENKESLDIDLNDFNPFTRKTSSEIETHVSQLKQVFSVARQHSPSILFIDEFDLLSKHDALVGELLTQLDGFVDRKSDRVVILAATNKLDKIDQRLMRPGRFDHVVELRLPEQKERRQLFSIKTRELKLAPKVEESFDQLAELTTGFTGCEIQAICDEAGRLAARHDLPHVTQEMFQLALDREFFGYPKEVTLSREEEERSAYHEGGHALVALLQEREDKIEGISNPFQCLKATIVPHETMDGVIFSKYNQRVGMTKRFYENRIRTALAGLQAEIIMLKEGNQSCGSSSDLQTVYSLLREMIRAWLIPFIPSTLEGNKLSREEDKELVLYLQKLKNETIQLLQTNRPSLAKLANALLEKKTLEREEMILLIQ